MTKTMPPDQELDITGAVCPMTFVRTRLALDKLSAGQVLRVRMYGEEPRINVPMAARQLGHIVLDLQTDADGISTLLLQCKA